MADNTNLIIQLKVRAAASMDLVESYNNDDHVDTKNAIDELEALLDLIYKL